MVDVVITSLSREEAGELAVAFEAAGVETELHDVRSLDMITYVEVVVELAPAVSGAIATVLGSMALLRRPKTWEVEIHKDGKIVKLSGENVKPEALAPALEEALK